MTPPNMQNSISTIIEHIAQQGYAVIEHFMSPEETHVMAQQAKALQSTGEMHRATTGVAKLETPALRGDFIHWIEANEARSTETVYLSAMAELQQSINQALFLGLFELESHFAIYPPGAGYQKHLDRLIGKEERKVSCILYLNDNWNSSDGGALRMYLDKKDDSRYIDISPHGGTLVLFLSSDFLHEVLPAQRERMSVTGWFKTRSLNN